MTWPCSPSRCDRYDRSGVARQLVRKDCIRAYDGSTRAVICCFPCARIPGSTKSQVVTTPEHLPSVMVILKIRPRCKRCQMDEAPPTAAAWCESHANAYRRAREPVRRRPAVSIPAISVTDAQQICISCEKQATQVTTTTPPGQWLCSSCARRHSRKGGGQLETSRAISRPTPALEPAIAAVRLLS